MNLLVTGAWAGAKENMDRLKMMGHEVIFLQQEKDELPCDYSWVEGVVCNGLFLSHPIEKFKNLRYVQLTSAGFDRVPMEYVKEHKIEIRNARGVYSIPMAEYAITGVLQLYKKMDFFRMNQREKCWEKNRNLFELCGKNVCIVGCGSVGNECAKRFQAFGCKVIGIDIICREDSLYEEILPIEKLDQILENTDILILTVPLSAETKGLMDKKRLEKIKASAIIVNIARGALIDEKALLEHLAENRLGGAVLDVFEQEPLNIDNELWNRNNVIITPHNSFVGEGNKERLNQVILDNLRE